jgi:DNA polymerase III psi subunit
MVLPLVKDVLRSLTLREAAVFASSAAQSSRLPTWQRRPYLKAMLETPRLLAERKTRVKHAEVITARVVQDERGWLRLAG